MKAKLVCLDDSTLAASQKGLSVALDGDQEQVVGREKRNAIFIDIDAATTKVSRKHAVFYPADGGWGLRDLNSSNGVFVNGKRITDVKLNAGDMIKFGDLPFRYDIERPETPGATAALDRFRSLGEGETEKTMMFGDVRASSKLLAAQDAKDPADAAPEAPRKPPPPVAKPTARPTASGGSRAQIDQTTVMDAAELAPRAKVPVGKTVFFILLGVLILGGLYFGFGMLRESSTVESKRDAVNRFVREAAVSEDPKRFGDERKALDKLRQELLAAIKDAPDKAELGILLGRVTVLEFERSFHEAMAAGNLAGARDAIDATRRKLAGVPRKSADGSPDMEAENLLSAMEPTIAFAGFAKKYPDPQKKDAAPAPAQLDELLKLKAEFGKYQKAVNMDLVRYPYLARLLEQGNQDIRLVERWELALRMASK